MNLFYINFFYPDSILLHGKDNCHCRAKLRVIWAPKLVTTQIADIYTAANHVADNRQFLKHQQRGRIEIGTAPHCIRSAPTHQKLLPEQAHHCEQHSFRSLCSSQDTGGLDIGCVSRMSGTSHHELRVAQIVVRKLRSALVI